MGDLDTSLGCGDSVEGMVAGMDLMVGAGPGLELSSRDGYRIQWGGNVIQ